MAEDKPDRKDRPTDPKSPGPGMHMPRSLAGWVVFVGFALILVVLLSRNWPENEPMDISTFWKNLDQGNIDSVLIKGNGPDGVTLVVTLKDGTMGMAPPPQGFNAYEVKYPPGALDTLMDRLGASENPLVIGYDQTNSLFLQLMVSIVPWLLIGLLIFFVFRQLRGAAGGGGMLGNFGRSKHRLTTKEHTNVSFSDVAGVEEAKEEVTEIIEFLKNPKRFQRLGGRIPRGVLLVGEPGCGKTLLAKAIAGEADVPFFSISGSDFVEMFVGVGASRVRDLFKQAKENSPCIIFLDEIDAVGRRRGGGFNGGGHDEREQTLNAILVEMDGFDTSDGVIVIAATNRADVLDPALVRPGRFDRQVYVSLADVKGRLEILKVHARKIKLGPDVELSRLARGTPMFSGADLAAVVNEAALLATMGNKEFVEQEDLEEARDKVRWGRAKKSRVVEEQDKKITAYHEAGHALTQVLLPDTDPLHKVTIIPRGPSGGATFSLPERDRMVFTRRYILNMIQVTLGGRIAEDIFCGDISSGASSDIRQATSLARQMVTDWGMNERLGFVFYGEDDKRPSFLDLGGGREYSDDTARMIDEELKKIIDSAYAETEKLLTDRKDRLEAIAEALLKYETLDGSEVQRIIDGETLDRPTVGDLLDADDARPTHPPIDEPSTSPDLPPAADLGGGALPQPG